MPRSIDFSSLTKPERAVIISGIGLFVDGVIPWWYRTDSGNGSFSYNAGLTGWGTVAVVAGAVAVIAVILRASIWPDPAPARDGTLYAALGAIAIVSIMTQIVSARGRWLGMYVGLIAAIGLLIAGIRRLAHRRAGWR